MDNRRSHPRHKLDWPILLRSDGTTRRIGELVNISLSGLHMNLEEPVPPSAAGTFQLFLCHPTQSADMLEIHGQTVWMKSDGEDNNWGLELVDLNENERATLSRFIGDPEDLAIELEFDAGSRDIAG